MKRLLAVACVFLAPMASALAQGAPSITGTWTTQTEVQGIAVNETCVITQAADGALSGTCDTSAGKFKLSGKITDKKVNFSHPSAYQGEDGTVSFFGTVDDPTTISGSIDMQPLNAGGAFAMKKQSK